ncbi:MAG: DUF262 domain-containing protein [Bifidobacterium dentium]
MGADQINTLFDDLTEYVKGDLDSEYFLGCVVTYRNGKEQEVIDGQQRLTTLFLLLRALYKKLEGMSDSKARTNLMNRIAPTLWRTDQITGEADRSSTLIESRAIDDDANATLKMILETGETDPNAKDPYSLNYRLLERRINDYAAEESLNFHLLASPVLLDDVIVLPIKADSQDTALMIFNTLNDRGLSLSDATSSRRRCISTRATAVKSSSRPGRICPLRRSTPGKACKRCSTNTCSSCARRKTTARPQFQAYANGSPKRSSSVFVPAGCWRTWIGY